MFTYAKADGIAYDPDTEQAHPGYMFEVIDLDTGTCPVDNNGEPYAIEEINTAEGWFLAYSNDPVKNRDWEYRVRVENRRLQLRPMTHIDP